MTIEQYGSERQNKWTGIDWQVGNRRTSEKTKLSILCEFVTSPVTNPVGHAHAFHMAICLVQFSLLPRVSGSEIARVLSHSDSVT